MKNNNIITPIALLLFIGSVSYLAVEIGRNDKLHNRLADERLNSESLLSEKLLLEKKIFDTKSQYKSLAEEKDDLERDLSATSQKLERVSKELQNVQSRSRLISNLTEQNTKLMTRNDFLERQFADQTIFLNETQSSKDNLELSITLLQEQNKDLVDELTQRRNLTMNEMLIESAKKNSKLTVSAKRTKKIVLNADIPSNAENLSFKITNPSGKENKSEELTFVANATIKSSTQSQVFYVASSSFPVLTYNRVQMIYSPQNKLMVGLYTIEVLSNNRSIGSLQVKLR